MTDNEIILKLIEEVDSKDARKLAELHATTRAIQWERENERI